MYPGDFYFDDYIGGFRMRVKAMFTIEAAVVFSLLTMIIIVFMNLGFSLHDRVLNDSVKIQGGLRYQEADFYHYDSDKKRINYGDIIGSPVFKKDNFSEVMDTKIMNNMKAYFSENVLGEISEINFENRNQIIKNNKNANILRYGSKASQLIGELINGS